jgi:hypothetical protein
MSRLRSFSAWAKAAVVVSLAAPAVAACDEDGKSLPAACADPLPLDDIANAGAPEVSNPCVTPIGDAVSSIEPGGSNTTAGASSGGAPNAGQGGADASAGGS